VSPVGLARLLEGLPKTADSNLLVGFETGDDAGVYRISADSALVHTADIITPPVDDPAVFGRIAAANALSDVYAMGGRPLTCLNLIGFPSSDLGADVLAGIVSGALEKITEAGAVLAGGHTMDDDEPKFGLSVTGIVHPDHLWRNVGARAGDALILTKPIGSGVLFNANLKGWVDAAAMAACYAVISTLNKVAAEVFAASGAVHAATDVTGFGLAGHALEMAHGSGVSLHIDVDRLPQLAQALAMYERGMTTGVNVANHELVDATTRFDRELSPAMRELLIDPQTSGGLLVAVDGPQADATLQALLDNGVEHATLVGHVADFGSPHRLVFH
jgi:selenide, water dikinase